MTMLEKSSVARTIPDERKNFEHWENFSNPEEENEMIILIAAAEKELMEKYAEGKMQEEERVEEGKTSRLEEDKSSLVVEMTTTKP